jgi:hypothetical protein
MRVLRIDGSTVSHPEDLNYPLAEMIGCEPTNLVPPRDENASPMRVVVDRCDCLFDKPWVDRWQEQWRALLTAPDSQGRLAAVLFGRPLFREIAGGDASPLLNVSRVVTVEPLREDEVRQAHDLTDAGARVVIEKTGGHPRISHLFAQILTAKSGSFKQAVKSFEKNHRSYLVETIQDHPVGGQAILSDLLKARSPIHETSLIRLHFADADADGRTAIEDLCASGLVRRDGSGDCSIRADLLRDVAGIAEVVSSPKMEVPNYDSKLMDAAWRCLFFSENALRKLAADRLGEINPAWWILDVPPRVRAAAEGRRKGDGMVAAIDEPSIHPVMYLTVNELFEIILTRWDRVFASVFHPLSEDAFRESARDFETVRNRLAHSRPITPEQLTAFELPAKRLGLID